MTAKSATTTLQISAIQRDRIFDHARRSYPDECCGAIFGELRDELRIVSRLQEIDNSWDPVERRRRFLITPEEYMRVEKEADARGLSLLGFYHSHPNAPARPSEFDREHAWPWFIYPIVEVREGEPESLRAWRLRDDRDGYDEIEITEESDANH